MRLVWSLTMLVGAAALAVLIAVTFFSQTARPATSEVNSEVLAAPLPVLELPIVAFDGLPLPDGSIFSVQAEYRRRHAALGSGAGYVPPASIRWLAWSELSGVLRNQEPDEGEFVFFDPEFWMKPVPPGARKGFTEDNLQSTHPEIDRRGHASIRCVLRYESRAALARYTAKWVKRRVAVVIDGEILIAPVIEGSISDSIPIATPFGLSESDARRLMSRLRKD